MQPGAKPPSYAWVIAGAFFLVNGVAWGATQGSFGVFVKPITLDMGWSRTDVSAAASMMLIINFIAGIGWGFLADKWRIRGVMALSGALMGLGFFLTSTTHSLWQLYLFYGLVVAVGLGGVFGPLTGLTARWFVRRRGLAIGIGASGIGVGTATLPLMAERLITSHDWRFGFLVMSFVVWAASFIGALLLKEPPAPRVDERSRAGSTAATLLDGPRRLGAQSSVRRTTQAAADGGVAVPLSAAVRTGSFWLMLFMMMAAALVLQTILVHLVPRAIDLGIPSASAVTLLVALGIMSTIGKVGGGALGDRVGPRLVFIGSLTLQGVALVWLTLSASLWMLYVFAAAFGLGYGGWTPQIPSIAARTFGSRNLGAIIGGMSLGGGAGGVIGPILAGFMFDTTGSYRIAFSLAAVAAAAGVALALLLKEETSIPIGRPA